MSVATTTFPSTLPSSTTSRWTLANVTSQINAATNPTQVLTLLQEAASQLPSCTLPCMNAVSSNAKPFTIAYFTFICGNPETVVPTIQGCVSQACPAAQIPVVLNVFNVVPLGCMRMQQLLSMASTAAPKTVASTASGVSSSTDSKGFFK
ncbi:hypothetical protein BDR26DRAFT_850744 [Obelidium mucronatum]|nr:hypothetical protein BDR26DRAFT_850744 [Obelidium mucronatum]